MRRSIALLATLGLSGLPASAAEPPVGSYYCHSGSAALGLFSITGPGTYSWQSVATVDFKTLKDDPANGAGTYTVRGDGVMEFAGPFADAWQVVAKWEEGWIWFANDFGGVMRCGTVIGG